MATTRTDTSVWQWHPDVEAGGPVVTSLGYIAEGLDETLGTVVGVSPQLHGGYLVVDGTGWLESGRGLVPAGAVRGVDHVARQVDVGLKRKDLAKAQPFYDDCDRETYRRSTTEHFTERVEKRTS
jgi:hypothetical protein